MVAATQARVLAENYASAGAKLTDALELIESAARHGRLSLDYDRSQNPTLKARLQELGYRVDIMGGAYWRISW